MAKANPEPRRETPRRILIVDDHPMMRKGLTALIEVEPGLAVCGEATNCKAALAAIRKKGPDLVIVDLSLEGSDGMDLLKEMKQHHPKIPALVLSMHDEALFAERVFRAGASGFVAKHEMGEAVLTAIRSVLAGERHMSGRISARFAEQFLDRRSSRVDSPLGALSDRELQVFRLIGAGRKNREIALTLRVSVKTVESHREHIKAKLKLESSGELIRRAAEWDENGGYDR